MHFNLINFQNLHITSKPLLQSSVSHHMLVVK